jgi:DNA invertase Pin-like site-specific DNA recombinase
MNKRAAIYARKSTEQDGVAEGDTSVHRQVTGARAFIASRKWTLDESHVFVDDGASGVLFLGRPEFSRMMHDAAAGAFDIVCLFDLDRLGRHGQKTMEALNALADAGVEVVDFSTGQPVDVDSFDGETSAYLKTRMAQQFRDQIRKATKAAMRRKAEQGYATGGKVFGYDNVRIAVGHAERRINEHEAHVVRDIYTRCAAGEGARTIAGSLNRAGVPKPRAQQGRRDGWSMSTVKAILTRPLYRGEVIYGKTSKAYGRELRKVYRGTKREKGQIRQDEGTWVRIADPDVAARVADRLRIIDPDLAARVDARLLDRRTRYLASVAKGDGRSPEKAHGKYLLSGGMLICPTCGGHFEGRKNPWRIHEAYGHPDHVYVCSTRRRKPGCCPNTLALPIDETDGAVLSIVEGEVLGTRFIGELLALVDNAPDETTWLTAERDRLQTEVDRLVASIAAGVPADTVAPLIRTNDSAIRRLETRLRQPRVPQLGAERLRAALEQRAKAWQKELRAEPHIARLVLRRLVGPLTLWDESERPDFVRFETTPTVELLDGLAPTLLRASPPGFEPGFWP